MNYQQRKALKVGDSLMVVPSNSYDLLVTMTVTKVTETQLTLSDKSRWMIETGREVGSGTSWRLIRSLETVEEGIRRNAEINAARQRRTTINRLRNFHYDDLEDEILVKLVAMLPKEKEVTK